MRKFLMTSVAVLMLAAPGWADVAVIVANGDYRTLPDAPGGAEAARATGALGRAGFAIVAEDDATTAQLRAQLARLIAEAPGADRVVVALSGHFRHSDQETWLLPADAKAADLAAAVEAGLPVSAVLTVLGAHPGRAVLVLGAQEAGRLPVDEAGFLTDGIGRLEVPQGVTVLSGAPRSVARFLRGTFLQPGAALADVAAAAELRAEGYLPRGHALIAAAPPVVSAPASAAPPPDESRPYWDLARRENTAEGYRLYLDRFPRGANAAEARDRLAAIESAPGRLAQAAEDALRLSRDQRRQIQQHLTILGFDTRGVDGVFGAGSRAAISRWQAAQGFEATGFLTQDQVTGLSAQGARRAAELEAEAAARRAEQERADRLYWDQTGAVGDEAGLRAYLQKYPKGLFADLATERLSVFEGDRRSRAVAEDRAAWDRAQRADTIAAYRDYLASRRDPAFRAEAQARIAALAALEEDSGAEDAARAREDALNLPAFARTLVETQLEQLGLRPGPADGRFDQATRRAIRRFQEDRDLPVTGYLDQATLSQLLTGRLLPR